jgi:hypothetical protein
MVMKTFLKRHWTPAALRQLPVSFLAEVLLPALTSPIHYKGTNPDIISSTTTTTTTSSSNMAAAAAAGTATEAAAPSLGKVKGSNGDEDEATQASWNAAEHAAKFLGKFLQAADAASCRAVITAGISCLGGQEVSRVGFRVMLSCLAAAADASGASGKFTGGCIEPGGPWGDGLGTAELIRYRYKYTV